MEKNELGQWIETLKAGDKVIINGRGTENIATVNRFTATRMFITTNNGVSETAFRRVDGKEISPDNWHTNDLVVTTPEKLEAVRGRNRRLHRIRKLSEFQWERLDAHQIEAVFSLVESFNPNPPKAAM